MNTLNAFFFREWKSLSANRMIFILPLFFLIIGSIPTAGQNISSNAPLFLLQVLLYLVPLVSVIAGCSSAQNDQVEIPLLVSLPINQFPWISGKFLMLMAVMGIAELGLILPSLFMGASGLTLLELWFFALGLNAVFISLGLASGFFFPDGVKAYLAAIVFWLCLTFVFGLAAWTLSSSFWAKNHPALWSTLLMISPLDSMRIAILFNIEAIPFAVEDLNPSTRAWLNHSGAAFALVCLAWTTITLVFTNPIKQNR